MTGDTLVKGPKTIQIHATGNHGDFFSVCIVMPGEVVLFPLGCYHDPLAVMDQLLFGGNALLWVRGCHPQLLFDFAEGMKHHHVRHLPATMRPVPDESGEPVDHPQVHELFGDLEDGQYEVDALNRH